jgi:hypothetical protein
MKVPMKHVGCSFLLGLLINPLCAAYGEQGRGLTPPDIVQVEHVRLEEGAKIIIVGNDKGRYVLSCNIKAIGCLTPLPGIDYFVFNKDTHWKIRPNAKEFMTLKFLEDWTETYNDVENIGLVPTKDTAGGSLGVYILESWTRKNGEPAR